MTAGRAVKAVVEELPPMRERILEAATKAFFIKGYHGTTVREILSACGVSSAAMYNHYKSKDELLYAIHQEAYADFEKYMDKALAGAGRSPEQQLRRLVAAFVEYQATHHDTAHVIDSNYMHLPEHWQSEVKNRRRGFRGLFRDAIERGAAEGVFKLPDSDGVTPPGLLAAIVIGDYCMRLASWFRPERGMNAERMGEIYADLAVRMLRPDGAPKTNR